MPSLPIEFIQGDFAPRYDSSVPELTCDKVVVTERGMKSGKPLVDFQFSLPDGKRFYFVTTGSLAIMLGEAIKGVNMRNHGKENP